MTDKQQPEALRQAAWLKREGASCQRHYDLGVLIERQHAELETLTLYKSLADEYGLSIFKDLKDLTTEVENLRAKLKTHEDLGDAGGDVQLLRMGYAAARLEIQSLQVRIKTMAEKHSDELMVAHLDGRMRAEQPAGAQQPGAGTWTPLPGTLPEPGKPVLLDIGKEYPIRAMWAAKHTLEVGVEDDSGFGEYDEATGTYYCPEGWYEWNEHEEIHWAVDKTPTAWCELPPNGGASHGQAPAQPAPQQEASPTAGMNIAQRILHVGGRNNAAGYVEFGSIQAVEALVKQVLRDLPAPQPSTTSQGDALDAARESEYRRGYRHGYEQRDAEVRGALA